MDVSCLNSPADGEPFSSSLIHRVSPCYFRQHTPVDNRYFRWLFCLEETRAVTGDIVELGVGPGRFFDYCASWLKQAGPDKTYYGFDTFAGFPSVRNEDLAGIAEDRKSRAKTGFYAFHNRARLERRGRKFGIRAVFVEGDFAETLPSRAPSQVSFLYIDCDLYAGYRAGLENLYERVSPSGIILFDEYEHVSEWPGARRAVDEFFIGKVEKPEKLSFSTSYFVKKEG